MVEEILKTRIMVKKSMKQYKGDKVGFIDSCKILRFIC